MTKLLTLATSSPKLVKYTGNRYLGAILYLASARYDKRLCPNAGDCIRSCLVVEAGRGAIGGPDNTIQRARKRKSDWLLNDRESFIKQLNHEIELLKRKATKLGKQLVLRLNGGSDLDWSDVYKQFPDVQFWEYTKRPDLAIKLSKLKNVHMTYSYNERTTDRIMGMMIGAGINIAMVLNVRRDHALPATIGNIPVIDGDLHDYRFLDTKGVIVGLRLKSLRRVENTKLSGGFVQAA